MTENTVNIRVRVDDDTASGLAAVRSSVERLRRDLISRMTSVGRDSSRSFSNGFEREIRTVGMRTGSSFSKSFAGGISAGGPQVKIAMIAAATAAAGPAALAVSAAVTGAFGTGVVGLGVHLLKDLPQVKKKWSKTLKDIKKDFTEAARPLLPVLETARHKLESLASSFAPHFKSALANAAPHLNQFLGHLSNGIKSFGKQAFHPMMKAFGTLLDTLGPEIEIFMNDMGVAFKGMANLVRNHSTEIAAVFKVIFWSISRTVGLITTVGTAFVGAMKLMSKAVGVGATALQLLSTAAINAFGTLIHAAAKAFGWIPGLGPKLKKADSNFSAWAKHTKAKINDVANKARDMDNVVTRANRARKLKANISEWKSKIDEAKAKLKSVPKEKKAALKARIDDLQAKVANAKSQLKSIKDKTAKIWGNKKDFDAKAGAVDKKTFKDKIVAIKAAADAFFGIWNRIAGLSLSKVISISASVVGKAASLLPGFAKGGISGGGYAMVGEQGPELLKYASGGQAGSGRHALVGENGPELVKLPHGSKVTNHRSTKQRLAANLREHRNWFDSKSEYTDAMRMIYPNWHKGWKWQKKGFQNRIGNARDRLQNVNRRLKGLTGGVWSKTLSSDPKIMNKQLSMFDISNPHWRDNVAELERRQELAERLREKRKRLSEKLQDAQKDFLVGRTQHAVKGLKHHGKKHHGGGGGHSNISGGGGHHRKYSGGGGDHDKVTILIKSGGNKFEDALVEVLRHAIRVRGGNVQTVLGKR